MSALKPYAVGGALRPDALSGLSPAFADSLANMFGAAPEPIRNELRVSSAFRSPEVQNTLWQQALAKYGTPEAARKWVAPPGRSQHNHGMAADLSYLSPAARQWAHANAGTYGLAFPLPNEDWHIELAGARDQPRSPVFADPKTPPPVTAPAAPGPALPMTPPAQPQAAPPPSVWAYALAGLQQFQQDRERRQADDQAERQRRAALFSQIL